MVTQASPQSDFETPSSPRSQSAASTISAHAGREAYLRDILTKIAEGHTINRIDELVPWRMIPAATTAPP